VWNLLGENFNLIRPGLGVSHHELPTQFQEII
jgi:hypothetical protein